jgi:hypothetical protein
VAGDRDHDERAGADRDPVVLADPLVDRDTGLLGDRVGVGRTSDDRGAGPGDDLGEGPVVVPVLVGRDHGREPAVADQLEERWASSAASISTCSPVSLQRRR